MDCLLILALAIFSYRKLLNSHMILRLDLDFPVDPTQWLARNLGAWDTWLQCGRDSSWQGGLPIVFVAAFFSSLGVGAGLIEKSLLVLFEALSGWSMYYLTRRYGRCGRVGCFVSSLFYMFNPWVTDRILYGHLLLYLGYSIIPLVVTLGMKSFESGRIKDSVIAGMSLCLLATFDLRLAYLTFGVILAFLLFQVLLLATKRKRNGNLGIGFREVCSKLKVLTAIAFTTAFLSMYWLLPSLIVGREENVFGIASRFWIEDIYLHSQASPVFPLALRYYVFSAFSEMEQRYLTNPLWLTLVYSSNVLAFLSLFVSPRKKMAAFFAAVAVVSIYLGMGTSGLGNLYLWLYYNLPGFDAFRDPNVIISVTCIAYAFLIGLTADAVLMIQFLQPFNLRRLVCKSRNIISPARQVKVSVFLGLILISVLVNSWPMFTGDFNGELQDTILPPEYTSVRNWLACQEGDFRVLVLPIDYGQALWSRVIFHDPFYISPPKPVITSQNVASTNELTSRFLNFVENLIYENRTRFLGKILGIANVKYVLLHTDVFNYGYYTRWQSPEAILGLLQMQDGLRLVLHEGSIYVFENSWFIPRVFASNFNVVVSGSRDSLVSLCEIGNLSFDRMILYYADQLDPDILAETLGRADALMIQGNSFIDLIFSSIKNKYNIIPFDNVGDYADPKSHWVKSTFYPKISDIYARGADFNEKGFIFTNGTEIKLAIPIRITYARRYDLWARVAYEPPQGRLSVLLDEITLVKNFQPLTDTFQGFSWVKLATVDLNEGNHVLSLVNEKGATLIDRISLLPAGPLTEYYKTLTDVIKNSSAQIIYSLEAEVAFGVDLGGWRLEHSVDASNGYSLVAPSFSSNVEISTQIFFPRPDRYLVAIRAGPTVNDGRMIVTIDKQSFEISYKAHESRSFRYKCLGPLYLEDGNHKMTIASSGDAQVDQVFVCSVSSTGQETLMDDILWRSLKESAPLAFIFKPPAEYRINATSKTPFSLVLGESFSPLWKIATNEEYEHIIAYSFLNSFYFAAGNQQVLARYEAQNAKSLGFTMAGTSLVLLLAYVVFTKSPKKRETKNVLDCHLRAKYYRSSI